jgi:hypothetical protein
MNGLGRLFDIGTGIVPVDSQAGAMTGKRVELVNASGLTVVVFKGAGTGTDHPVITVKQHTAASGGTTGNAPAEAVTAVYAKSETVLDNDESWVNITPFPANPVISTTLATSQAIIAIEIDAKKLTDGYTHASVDIADTGAAGAQLLGALYILHGLKVERAPTSLPNLGTGVATA